MICKVLSSTLPVYRKIQGIVDELRGLYGAIEEMSRKIEDLETENARLRHRIEKQGKDQQLVT